MIKIYSENEKNTQKVIIQLSLLAKNAMNDKRPALSFQC
jgi:hypothetical protein